MKKILLVITKGELGGAQVFVLNLAKSLQKKGIEVAVASGAGDYLPAELGKLKIPYFRLENLQRGFNPFQIRKYLQELKNLLKKEKFSVVHFNSSNTLSGGLISYGLGIKSVFTVHGLSVLNPAYRANFILKLFYRFYFKFLLKFINHTVFVSHYDKKEALRQKIVKAGEVIYNGLDLKDNYFLDKEEARKEIEKLSSLDFSQIYLIGSIGRLAPPKNYQFLIKNWQLIKEEKTNAKLIIIGEGPERKYYETLINKAGAGGDIILLGALPEASRFLKAFDLFVLPSIYEGLSISLIETLFAQIPVVASDLPGNIEVIGENNTYQGGDINSFLGKLKNVSLTSRDSSQFGINNLVDEYLKVYQRDNNN